MKTLWMSYAALLALLALTVSLSFFPLGRIGLLLSLGIAGAKASLVMLFFMHLKQAGPLIRVAAAAGFVWLSILLTHSFFDFFFRRGI